MNSRPDAFMPLWIADYLADTSHLTCEQHGAYLLLLMAYWRRGGPLPANAAQIASIVKMTPQKWKSVSSVVMAFFEIEAGLMKNKRADEEIRVASVLKNKKVAAGRKGAEKRWSGHGRPIVLPCHVSSENTKKPMANAWQNGSPSPSVSKKQDSVPSVNEKVNKEKAAAPTSEAKPPATATGTIAENNLPNREMLNRRLAGALGITIEELYLRGKFQNFVADFYNWKVDGCDPELDIWPTITKLAAQGRTIHGPRYFHDTILEARDWRISCTPTPAQAKAAEYKKFDEAVIAYVHANGWWHDSLGPKPGEQGCKVPPEILNKHLQQKQAATA